MSVRTGTSRSLRARLGRVRRDEALRSSPIWLLVTALNTSVGTGVLAFNATRTSTDISRASLLLVFWLAIAVFLSLGRGRARCWELDLALPLSSRELWLSHLAATVLSGVLALTASIGVVAAHEILLGISLGWETLLAPIVAGLIVVAVAIQSHQRDLRSPPRGRFNLVLLGSLAVVLSIQLALIDRPWMAALLLLLAALVIGSRTLAALAPVFSVVPTEPEASLPPAERDRRAGEDVAARKQSWTWMTLFSILHHAPPWGRATPWVLYCFITAIGFVMAGGLALFTQSFDDRILRLIYLPLASYGLFSGIGVLLYQSFRVEPLPISRARLFGVLMLPTLAMFLVGFAGARVALGVIPKPQLVNYRIHGEYYWVDVPVRYLSIGTRSEVPTIEAPWGESHAAWSAPLFRGGDTVLYSLFNTSEKSSARFEALLTSRAVEAIYGRKIAPGELLERYFLVGDDKPVGFKPGGFGLLSDHPGLVAPDDGPEGLAYLAPVILPWLVVSTIFFRTFRAPSSERTIKVAYWTIMILLLAVMLGLAAGMVTGLYNAEGLSAILGIGIRKLGQSAVGVAIAWVVFLGLAATCYLVAQRQYRRCELPASPVKLSLIDFAPGDS